MWRVSILLPFVWWATVNWPYLDAREAENLALSCTVLPVTNLCYKLGSGAMSATMSEEITIIIFSVICSFDFFFKNSGRNLLFRFSYACKMKYNFQVREVICTYAENSEHRFQECSSKDFKIIMLKAENVKLCYCKAIILKQANSPIYYYNCFILWSIPLSPKLLYLFNERFSIILVGKWDTTSCLQDTGYYLSRLF